LTVTITLPYNIGQRDAYNHCASICEDLSEKATDLTAEQKHVLDCLASAFRRKADKVEKASS
jgi:hypothetical protein